MCGLKRYKVTIKETGFDYYFFSMKSANKFMSKTAYECQNQDDSWDPTFVVSEEYLKEEEN